MKQGYVTDDCRFRAEGLEVMSHMVDARGLLKPAALMDMAQEMAYGAAEAMGFGYSDLSAKGLLWVMSRFEARVAPEGMPRWGESVDMTTWCKTPVGPFFLRDFRLTPSRGGEAPVVATSAWSVISTRERRLLRGAEIAEIVPERWNNPDFTFAQPAAKVAVPRNLAGMELSGYVTASYSDIDVNTHANNARILAWAMDALPYSLTRERSVSHLCVNYLRETRACERVALWLGNPAPDTFIVAGFLAPDAPDAPMGEAKFAVELAF